MESKITVPADVPASAGARSSASTILTEKSGMFSSKFIWVSEIIPSPFYAVDGVIERVKSRGTSSVPSW